MNDSEKPLILCVDDESVVLKLMERLLTKNGFRVLSSLGGPKAISLIHKNKPDVILMDAKMPQMSGQEMCSRLQENEDVSMIPVIFVSGHFEESEKNKVSTLGAVDFLTKPFDPKTLVEKVVKTLHANRHWKALEPQETATEKGRADFEKFKTYLETRLGAAPDARAKLAALVPATLYGLCSDSELKPAELAQMIAEFLDMDYLPHIDPESIQAGILSPSFCKAHSVVPIGGVLDKFAFALSNPFDWNLREELRRFTEQECPYRFVAEPATIASLFAPDSIFSISPGRRPVSPADVEPLSVAHVSDQLLSRAITHRASDIHIEPKEFRTSIRFRIDGEMREMFSVPNQTGTMLISRLKALGGLDISEKRKPQDGSVEVKLNGKTIKLRLATTGTSNGESMIMRLLDPDTKPADFRKLGMTGDQAQKLADFANRPQGLLLVVGPTGAGKTTTLYSLLSMIDGRTRSLMSVEDPVEYRIPSANQQQVNEKAGVTFESLLKSSVRQDPDVLFIGEVRDLYSAKVALDFSSTGHLTLSTLHTSNATTAIFRLERLGVERSAMADTILGIIAQRLLKKLCTYCRKIEAITPEERDLLSTFDDQAPDQVAHAVGCQQCDYTGYSGREGVYEIFEFNAPIRDMIRANKSIAEIRAAHRQNGGYLIGHHALQKVRDFLITPKDAYENVLVEETRRVTVPVPLAESHPSPTKTVVKQSAQILCVEDDPDTQALMKVLLQNQGYSVTLAGDGIDALLQLGKTPFDLIISDLNMPRLNGMMLLEMMNQKEIKVPVLFLTADTNPEMEAKVLGIGAADYVQKPLKKESFLLRVKKALL